jgi:hypothetical protein
MVNLNIKVMTPTERANARLQRVKDARPKMPGIRVVPADGDGWTADDMRKLLKHPKAGGFRADGDIEWPDDTFTNRRLREGSIKLSELVQSSEEPQKAEPQEV